MKHFRLIMALVLAIGTAPFIFAQEEIVAVESETVTAETVEVLYFHNERRCATCMAVEEVTKSTLEENYADQLKNGTLTFESVNIEDDANEPLARKLKVSGQTLLVLKDGKKKDLTNDAFLYARSNPEKLQEKIVKAIGNL